MARSKNNNGTPDLRTPDPLQGGSEDESEDLGYQGSGLDMEDEVSGDEPLRFGERRTGQERRVSEDRDWTQEERRSGFDRRTAVAQVAQ